MKKARANQKTFDDRDTMRPEYDFTGATRGVTAERYAQGTNVVAVDPDVRDVFPDSGAVNEALRALAPLLREQRGGRGSRTLIRPPVVKGRTSPVGGGGVAPVASEARRVKRRRRLT